MSSRMKNRVRPGLEQLERRDVPSWSWGVTQTMAAGPGLEQLERRDVPSATLQSIPGLVTAAVNSDANAHVVGALNLTIQRLLPPAGTYAGVGNASDHSVTISFITPNGWNQILN